MKRGEQNGKKRLLGLFAVLIGIVLLTACGGGKRGLPLDQQQVKRIQLQNKS
ncbi:hypothetical protein [Paracerasibacillus soli]|uniref:Lipoprotein n=1 Tax=Paracerasibacillus soli TaxID=480284 RepID=A0ABU5CRK1_9BACI|nr:hypothetical protein [Virgibacillus soli]MDY0408969.1 hypothetical protein [Virgibacillus soli]